MISWEYDLEKDEKLKVKKWCEYGFYVGEKIDIDLLKKYIDEVYLSEDDKEFFKFLLKNYDLSKKPE